MAYKLSFAGETTRFFMCCLAAVISLPLSAQQKGTTGKNLSATKVAETMLVVLDHTPRWGFEGALFGREVGKNWSKTEVEQVNAAMLRMWDAAQATSGESLDAMNKLQVFVTLKQWVDIGMGNSFRPAAIPVWEGRIKRIDLETARAWADVSQSLSLEQGGKASPAKVILFIAFVDGLFAGDTWKAGQPMQATARFKSFPDRAPISQWAEVTGLTRINAAVSLVQVNDLFAGDVFQPTVFQTALPVAQKILADRKGQ